jgi:hypothetical protein
MSSFLGKAVDFYKSGVKATMSAGLDIARDHLLPKQDISEENIISEEGGTDFSGHTGVVNSLAISADGETLFSAGKDQKIRMWHTRTGKSAGIVGDQKSEVKIRINPTGNLVFKKWLLRATYSSSAGQRDHSGQRDAILLRYCRQHHEVELARCKRRLCRRFRGYAARAQGYCIQREGAQG